MQGLFVHPAFQAGFAPLLSSFVVALVLRQFAIQWQGLAVIAGLLVAIQLTTGVSFQPLTSTNKILLCSLLLPFSAFFLDRYSCHITCRTALLALILAAAALWVVWPVVGRQESLEALYIGGRMVLYTAAIGAGLIWFTKQDLVLESGASIALGIGTGVAILIAASALYAQLAIAVSAALGGLLLIILLGLGRGGASGSLGIMTLFAVAVPLALLGGAATVFAQLPVMTLVFLALIPLFASISVFKQHNLWIRVILSTVLGLLPAVPAVWMAWDASGSMGY